MKLPQPQPDGSGTYILSDGSRIYQSSIHQKAWFLFIFSHNTKRAKGKPRPKGEILMRHRGIWYFDSPQQALIAHQEIKGIASKRC